MPEQPNPKVREFLLENLPALDHGKLAAAFSAEMQHVVRDCMDRPLDDKARTITIAFEVKPMLHTDSASADIDKVAVEATVTSKLPVRRTRVYEMAVKQDGRATFHPELPDDPEGEALFDRSTGEIQE